MMTETEQFGAIRTLTKFGVRTNGFAMRNYPLVHTVAEPAASVKEKL